MAVSGRITWDKANEEADKMIGVAPDGSVGKWHLATLTSERENDFVWNELGGNVRHYWLGGKKADSSMATEKEWGWVTREKWAYTNWLRLSEPNNSSEKKHYLSFLGGQEGKWMDVSGNWGGAKGYILEFTPVPLPASMWLLASGIVGLVAIRRGYC